jgi:hypothetical protein
MASTDDSNQPSPTQPLNRSARRTLRRRLLAALRAEGCTCSPTIRPDARPEAHMQESGWVSHVADCPLGRRLVGQPTLVFAGVKRCKR